MHGKKNGFIRVHKLVNSANVDGQKVKFIINVGEDNRGNLFYNIDDIDITRSMAPKRPSTSSDVYNNIINDDFVNFNPTGLNRGNQYTKGVRVK